MVSKVPPRDSGLASSVLGSDEMGITEYRDMVGSAVFVCHISISLLGEVSTMSRAELVEEMPFFLRFRVFGVVPLAPRFDMTEIRRERVVLHQPSRRSCLPPQGLTIRGWKDPSTDKLGASYM
jgi:hypothetical protein